MIKGRTKFRKKPRKREGDPQKLMRLSTGQVLPKPKVRKRKKK